jgi:hypothetical protein
MKIPSFAIDVVIGLVGLIATYYFYRRSIEKPNPRYGVARVPLIGGISPLLPSEVRVSYGNEPVKSLVKTFVLLWNDGTKTLDASDIAESDPIRLVLDNPESKILRTRVITASRAVNCASVEQDQGESKTEARITFSFLDPGDGFAVEVLHTGDDTEITVKGTIKGLPDGIKFTRPITSPGLTRIADGSFRDSAPGLDIFIRSFGFLVALFALSSPWWPTSFLTAGTGSPWNRWLCFGFAAIYLPLAVMGFWRNRNIVPKSIRDFDLTDISG